MDIHPKRRPSRARYVAAVLAVAAAWGVRELLLGPLGDRAPFLIDYPAVTIAALHGGVGPGLAATTLSAGLFLLSLGPEGLAACEADAWLATAVFLAGGAVISILAHMARHARSGALAREVRAEISMEREGLTQALRESEARYRRVFDTSASAMSISTLGTGRIIDINEAFTTFTGHTRQEAVGRTFRDIDFWADYEDRVCLAKRLEDTGRLDNEEVRLRRKGGEIKTALMSCTLMDLCGEQVIVTSVVDISVRKQAEEALRQAKAEVEKALGDMEFIAQATDLGLWSNDWPLNELNWNNQVKEHFWLSPQARPTLENVFALLHPEDREPTRRAYERAVAEGSLFDITNRVLAPDGRKRWIRSQGRAIYDETGQPVRFSGITQDVTPQKLLEGELTRARDELEERVGERTRELEVKNRELEDFTYIASHDLQEPLRKIQAFGQRLRDEHAENLGDEGRDYLRRMELAAGRMQALLEDLLAYSRVATRTGPFEPASLSILAREAMAELDQRLNQTGGVIEIGELPRAQVDHFQMRQVFRHLLSNGLKYHGDEPPRIKVLGQATGDRGREVVRVSVRDNGIGFDMRYAERIFQPFQRLHGRGAYEGTGIGLAIVKKVVERHGGTITAASEPGLGTEFVIELPMRQTRG